MLKNLTKLTFVSSILYLFIGGLLIFSKPQNMSEEYKNTSYTDYYSSNEIGPDRVLLINDPLESGIARIKIIENATETLDVSYFSIEKGETPSLFLVL